MPDVDPWAAVIAAAQSTVHRIEQGNILAARDVLQGAAVGLRDVLAGRLPDPERCIYLAYLLRATEQILAGVDPDKAIGLWTGSRPQSVPDERDFVLFLKVGRKLDSISRAGSHKPIEDAISAVAREFAANSTDIGRSTIEKAWKHLGGRRAWDAGNSPEADEGK